MNNLIKVLIIDDHRLFSDGIKTILSYELNINNINQINDAREAVNEVNSMNPDIILMDYNMPHMSGLESTELLLIHFPHLKIIFLSMHEENHIIEQIYKSGAFGYVSKTATQETFWEAINVVLTNEKYFSKKIVDMVQVAIHQNIKLTKREFQIMEKIKLGLTTKKIADLLCISHHTVETHRKNIIVKLNLRTE